MTSKPFRVKRVDQGDAEVAARIHRVQMLAYAQEALLLEAVDFPPLRRTVENVRACAEEHFAVVLGDDLVGVVAIEATSEGRNISSLVVTPAFQRRGIARSLLAEVLKHYGGGPLTVQTGARNGPALSLYGECGFVEASRWLVGPEPLEIVRLRRAPGWTGPTPPPSATSP
jgi:GNAT superfamily N-acetyltransferase